MNVLALLLVLASVAAAAAPVARSRVAFTLPERTLVPEGIAYDPETGDVFVGSIHQRKVVRVRRDGTVADFVPSGAHGLRVVLGLEVDPARRLLWAATAGEQRLESERGFSAVIAFDLATGRPAHRVEIDRPGEAHLFNDLAIAADGALFVTDSEAGTVLRVRPGQPPETLPGRFAYPNGIALSDDGTHLFVAHQTGVDVLDTRRAPEWRRVAPAPGGTLAGIDGLSFHDGSLVAVQNGIAPERVARFALSPGRDRVLAAEVLEMGHPRMRIPTTGVVAAGALLFIANSQLDRREEGHLPAWEALDETAVLSVPLAGAPRAGLRRPDLVDLTRLEPGIRLDIRYASPRNFLGRRVYAEPRAVLQRPAAEAVARAHRALAAKGYGLLVFDAYRPWWVTRLFWDETPEEKRDFVADPRKGSKHNRGCAVDLTLYDLATAKETAMPSAYDAFDETASPGYTGGTADERARRDLLRAAMEAEGFTVEPNEWWHFNCAGWEEYPVMDVAFADVPR